MSTYLLPFVKASQGIKTALVFLSIGGGFLFKNLQLNLYYKWGNSFVNPKKRGAFSARNEAISLAVGVVFTLLIGGMVDYFESHGAIEKSFIIIACVMAALTLIDFLMLLCIRNYDRENAIKQQKHFGDVIKNTLGNKSFRNVVIMISLYDIGRFLTIGFLGTYKTQDLLLSVGTVQIINIVACILRCSLSSAVGKWADRTSFAHVYRKGLWVCAVSFVFLIFTTPKHWWLIVAYTVLYNVSMTALPGNANNMTYSYVPIDYFVQAQAIRSSIAGTLGFLASLLSGKILSLIQANDNMIFGIHIFDSVEYKSHHRLEGTLGVAIVVAFRDLVSAPFAGGFESGILRRGFVDVQGVVPSGEVTDFMTMSFYLLDIILAAIVVILLPFVDVEKKLPEINAELLRRKKEAVLALGEQWIEPEEAERIEMEEAAKLREENRIADLKERCKKKGLDFDIENEKYLARQAEKELKKAKKNK